jgi:hypothetical protein
MQAAISPSRRVRLGLLPSVGRSDASLATRWMTSAVTRAEQRPCPAAAVFRVSTRTSHGRIPLHDPNDSSFRAGENLLFVVFRDSERDELRTSLGCRRDEVSVAHDRGFGEDDLGLASSDR